MTLDGQSAGWPLGPDQRKAIFRAEIREYGLALRNLEVDWLTSPRAAAVTNLDRDFGIYEGVWAGLAKTGLGAAPPDDAFWTEHLRETSEDFRERTGQLLRRLDLPAMVAADTAELLARLGLSAGTREVAEALRIVLHARAEATRLHRAGDWANEPDERLFALQHVPLPQPVITTPEISIPDKWLGLNPVQAAELFIESTPGMFQHRANGKRAATQVGEQTVRQIRWAATLLHKSMNPPGGGQPERPFWSCTHDDIVALDRWFDLLPTVCGKSPRDRAEGETLEAIRERAMVRVDAGELDASVFGLDGVTTNKHLRKLKQIWDHVRDDIPQLTDIRFNKFMVADLKDERDARDAYTVEQGCEIFALPPWTGCKSLRDRLLPGNVIIHDSLYFVLLIVWYTGVRREEVCKLLLDDIVYEDGLWVMLVRNTTAGRVKNFASVRNCVACDELVRLGFGKYVEALRAAGETALFPDLVTERFDTKKGDVFYRVWWQYIALLLTMLKRGQALHAARHAFDTELKELEVFPETRRDAMGHAGKHRSDGETRRYSKAARRQKLKALVDKVPIVTQHLPSCTEISLLPPELRLPRRARRQSA